MAPVNAYYVDADDAAARAKGVMVEDPSKVAPKPPADQPSLQELTKAQDKAADALVKAPDDPKVKNAFVVATVRLATATMADTGLTPKEKYPRALRLYREALKHDPKNEEALSNKELIEGIYTQMKRPIPQ
jgi:hypothetical protein